MTGGSESCGRSAPEAEEVAELAEAASVWRPLCAGTRRNLCERLAVLADPACGATEPTATRIKSAKEKATVVRRGFLPIESKTSWVLTRSAGWMVDFAIRLTRTEVLARDT
jgi:hypothetical protein